MEPAEALRRLTRARVGYFTSVGGGGEPHIVPVTFVHLDSAVIHMVDHKPKTTTRLKRISNIEMNPQASLLVDHYSEDWQTLWWVRVDGPVTVHSSGEAWSRAATALAEKYPQYHDKVPVGPAVYLSIDRVVSWEYVG